ncbi:MAG: START-like domain-containing protein [Bacteroidia bacterium]
MKSKTSKLKTAKKIVSKWANKPAKKTIVKKNAVKQLASTKIGNKKKEKEIVKKEKEKKTIKPVAKQVKSAKKTIKKEKVIKKALKPEKIKKLAVEKETAKDPKKDILTLKQSLKPKKGKGGRKPKSKDDDDEPEIANDELIEQIIKSTKRQSKTPKKPKILQTFVNPINSLTVAVSDDNESNSKKKNLAAKEPKGKFELEYVIRTSPGILYEFITTPSGLSEWFADDVNIRDGIFTFYWDGSQQKARLLGFKEDKYVRMQWLDKMEGTYFEFKIERDELTGDVSLIITDFADEVSDMQTSKLLWDSQIGTLLNVLGSN